MYPSKHNPRYGIFVKNFERAVAEDWKIKKIIITKTNNKIALLFKYIYYYIRIFFLFFKIKRQDLIYVHFPLYAAPPLSIFCFMKAKIILNFHGSDLVFDNFVKKILSIFQKCLVKKFYMVVPSEFYKKRLIEMYRVPSAKIYVYPSGGINPDIFYPKEFTEREFFTVSFVSSFISGKGWKIFLEAMRKLKENKDVENLRIIMVGDGPDKQKILDYIKKYELQVSVHSRLTHEQIAEIYRQSDVFVFPTTLPESLGLVGLEAMACGTPVIGTNYGGIKTYLKHGTNGFMFRYGDYEDLSNKIIRFYHLPSWRKLEMQQEAIKTASAYFTSNINKELISFLNKI